MAHRRTVVERESQVIKVGEEVEIVGIKETRSLPVLALKCSANCWTKAALVENVGVLPRGIKREEIERGQVLAKLAPLPHTARI